VSDAFTIWETHLPNQLGVSREEIREVRERHLQVDTDYVYGSYGRILLSPQGLEKLKVALGAESAKKAPSRKPQEAPAPLVEAMEVVRWRFANAHVIEAMRLNGELVTVRCSSNRKFRQGMIMNAVWNGHWWDAQQCPRWPGKW
jgi:hypothetical protein